MTIEIPRLPFNYEDLEPFISQQSMRVHYEIHHKMYRDKLNEVIRGRKFSQMPLRDIVLNSDGEIFTCAAQVWNHNFYWQCLSPKGYKSPNKELLLALEVNFGSFQSFQREFEYKALNNYGSGWTWLIKTANGSLKIINTRNADTPIVDMNTTVLLTIDVWEHAYYRDYENNRIEYLQRFWEFVNWPFVQKNYQQS